MENFEGHWCKYFINDLVEFIIESVQYWAFLFWKTLQYSLNLNIKLFNLLLSHFNLHGQMCLEMYLFLLDLLIY